MSRVFFTERATIWLEGTRYPGDVMRLIQIDYNSQNVSDVLYNFILLPSEKQALQLENSAFQIKAFFSHCSSCTA
jgi:hypothetical protein